MDPKGGQLRPPSSQSPRPPPILAAGHSYTPTIPVPGSNAMPSIMLYIVCAAEYGQITLGHLRTHGRLAAVQVAA